MIKHNTKKLIEQLKSILNKEPILIENTDNFKMITFLKKYKDFGCYIQTYILSFNKDNHNLVPTRLKTEVYIENIFEKDENELLKEIEKTIEIKFDEIYLDKIKKHEYKNIRIYVWTIDILMDRTLENNNVKLIINTYVTVVNNKTNEEL